MIDDRPSTTRLRHQKICPRWTPERSERALSGAYDVHPAAALPPSTKKPASIRNPAGTAVQNDAMLMRGNAMSGAPILSGMR